MLNSSDLDSLLYKILHNSNLGISGVVCIKNRPLLGKDEKRKEDIVINTTTITRDSLPQRAYGNVNIYVPDLFFGEKGYEPNNTRLSELTNKVTQALNNALINGMNYVIQSETPFDEPDINQHANNLRISWTIASGEIS